VTGSPAGRLIRNALGALVLLPVGIVIVMLAIANRHRVTISLDPFTADQPAIALTKPLYLIMLVAVLAGVVIGGVAAWLGQGRWRRAARRARSEARALRAETEALKARLEAAEHTPRRPAIAYRRPPAA
jgi:uncharacterized integral membrane protein